MTLEFSTVLSVAALIVSVTTMWLTLLRKGSIRMTQPTVIFLGQMGGDKKSSKIFFRTLLYSTSKKGRVIENLYVRLKRSETQQNFNIWVYGSKELNRGSGLFIGDTGIASNHHFLLPTDVESFVFKAGNYSLEIYAQIIGDKNTKLLHQVDLTISQQEAELLKQGDKGIYFDWGPDSKKYHTHIDSRPPKIKGDIDSLLSEVLLKDR
ncbi:MAG: hypothetical protein H6862_04675 [Rhodospirillales bacterium]|nr:hypothetical protein [Rhodospirillales bacterium]